MRVNGRKDIQIVTSTWLICIQSLNLTSFSISRRKRKGVKQTKTYSVLYLFSFKKDIVVFLLKRTLTKKANNVKLV